eukprot:TCONS_00043518-protein
MYKNVGHQRVITEVTKVLTCSSSPGDNEQTNILVNAMKTFKENFDDFRSYTISIQEKLKTQSSLDLSQSPSANNSSPTTSISNKLLRHLQNRVQQLRHENIQLKENLKNSLTVFDTSDITRRVEDLESQLQVRIFNRRMSWIVLKQQGPRLHFESNWVVIY